jgi:hypothetical protein
MIKTKSAAGLSGIKPRADGSCPAAPEFMPWSMVAEKPEADPSGGEEAARRMFGVALIFLAVVAALGALLRWQTIRPWAWVDGGHFLHAHSHTAFLGWVFNAFLAVALVRFVPVAERRGYGRLFVGLQVAMVGMLASFPVQGYGSVSIAFSTLHVIGSGVFVWWLWRRNTAVPVARGYLRVALVCLLVSGLGPLSLGPLAANGLRETSWYHLAIYFYLHAQYNGWFLFFLLAVLFQELTQRGAWAGEAAAQRARWWFTVGVVLTFAQSTLWLSPPGWVYALAGIGGAAQLVGCGYLLRALRGTSAGRAGPVRVLAGLAVGAFLLKHALQAAAAWPGLGALANQRFTVIAFLHLVFLGVVTPALWAEAGQRGWLRGGATTRGAVAVFLGGALVTEVLLVAVPLGLNVGAWYPPSLFAAALAMTVGASGLAVAFWTHRGAPGEG